MDGQVFKAIKRYNKIKPKDVKKIFGVDHTYLYKLEKNNISDHYKNKLADYLRIDLSSDEKIDEYVKKIPPEFLERKKTIRLVPVYW